MKAGDARSDPALTAAAGPAEATAAGRARVVLPAAATS